MKKIILHLILTFAIIPHWLNGQTIDTTYFSKIDTVNAIYYFKPYLNITKTELLNNINSIFGLNSDYTSSLFKENIDSRGYSHARYKQSYKTYPIENSMFIIHTDTLGKLWCMNGKIIKLNEINCSPIISVAQATDAAVASTPGMDYAWLNDSLNLDDYRAFMGDPLATPYPTTQLLITDVGSKIYSQTRTYNFVYKIFIQGKDPSFNKFCYIDAITGTSIINPKTTKRACFANHTVYGNTKSINKNNLPSCEQPCVQGTADILFYGNQNIITDKYKKTPISLCTYRLKNACANGTYLYVKDYTNNNYYDITDLSNTWGQSNRNGTTSLWSIERSHLYFLTKFGRSSYDNNSSQIKILTNSNNWVITSWDDANDLIMVGNKMIKNSAYVTTSWQASMDILGHELAHGIQKYTCGLSTTNYESAAISEGFCDIFGTMVEFNAASLYNLNGKTPNYDLGEDCFSDVGYRRSMSNPYAYGCSNAYLGLNYGQQYHLDAGVFDRWFYLLAEGGTGINGVGNSYCVQGLGKDMASGIAYNAMVNYLTPNSSFLQAGAYVLLAANGMYGFSFPTSEVAAANYAVNIGGTPIATIPFITIMGISSTNQNINLNNRFYVKPYTVNSGVTINMSSSLEIDLASSAIPATTTNQDVQILSGSEFHGYITAGCTNGSRFGDPNSSNNNEETSEITNTYVTKQNNITESVLIIPNPNSGNFTITTSRNEEVLKSIEIQNTLGIIIQTISQPTPSTEINIQNQAAGLYLVKLNYADKVITKKIVKQ